MQRCQGSYLLILHVLKILNDDKILNFFNTLNNTFPHIVSSMGIFPNQNRQNFLPIDFMLAFHGLLEKVLGNSGQSDLRDLAGIKMMGKHQD